MKNVITATALLGLSTVLFSCAMAPAFANELGTPPGTIDKSDNALVYDCLSHPDLDQKLVSEGQKLIVVGNTEGGNGFVVTYSTETAKGYVLHIDVDADKGCIVGNIKGGLIVFPQEQPAR